MLILFLFIVVLVVPVKISVINLVVSHIIICLVLIKEELFIIAMDLLENEIELVNTLCVRLKREVARDRRLKILDIGCGTGKLAIYIKEETNSEVTGVDPMQEQIEKAKQKARSAEVAFDVQSAEELNYVDGTFDVVVSLKALHEMDNPDAALRESLRVLREGGRIYIIDWIGGAAGTASHGHASKYFTIEGLEEKLSKTGFVRIEIEAKNELMLAEGTKAQ